MAEMRKRTSMSVLEMGRMLGLGKTESYWLIKKNYFKTILVGNTMRVMIDSFEELFDHSHELTPKEKEIWMLFDRVDVAELLARDAFAKGAYMLGAEDREIMLK